MSIKTLPDYPIRIATRRSPLAMAQTLAIREKIAEALGVAPDDWDALLPVIPFVTSGDKNQSSSLAEVGGKGLFTKEIEAALLNGEADIAVHSMKDMPAVLPPGLVIASVPAREDPRDALVTLDGRPFLEIAPGATIGTSSTRRAAQVRRLRPDLKIVPFRGNVGTRLKKLEAGEASGMFLAEAGLNRLGLTDVRRFPMPVDHMLPALGQGILCLQTRQDDEIALTACRNVGCARAAAESAAERAITEALDATCRTPMAGLGIAREGSLTVTAELLSHDGALRFTAADRAVWTEERPDGIQIAQRFGAEVAERLRRDAGADFVRILAG